MNLEMIQITPDYKPKESGRYLVRTISTSKVPEFLKKPHYFSAIVIVHENGYAIDINNQIATHISKEKL